MVKPIVISGHSERETPLQSARGGSHAYDQQTAHAESVAAWQKNKDQKDFIPNRTTGYQEMGFGISPDPSSMMEEFQFGKKGAVVTTGLQNNKDDSIPAATRIQQIKDPAEDNFEFSDESQTQFQVHQGSTKTGMFTGWEKPAEVSDNTTPTTEKRPADSVVGSDNVTLNRPELASQPWEKITAAEGLPPKVADQTTTGKSEKTQPTEPQISLGKQPDTSGAEPHVVQHQVVPISPEPNQQPVPVVSAEVPPQSVRKTDQKTTGEVVGGESWIQPPAEAVNPSNSGPNDFFGSETQANTERTEPVVQLDQFDKFESEFGTKPTDKKPIASSKQIVVETGGNNTFPPAQQKGQQSPQNATTEPPKAADFFDFGQPAAVGFKKKTNKTQVNAIVTDFFGNTEQSAPVEPQTWNFGAPTASQQQTEFPGFGDSTSQPAQVNQQDDPFAAFSFHSAEEFADPPTKAGLATEGNQSQPNEFEFFKVAADEGEKQSAVIEKIPEPKMEQPKAPQPQADPFSAFEFAFGTASQPIAPSVPKPVENDDIKEDTRPEDSTHTNNLQQTAVIEELPIIAEESREESQLGMQLGGDSHPHDSSNLFAGLPQVQGTTQELRVTEAPKPDNRPVQPHANPTMPEQTNLDEFILRDSEPQPKQNSSILDSSDFLGFPAFDQVTPTVPVPQVQQLKKQDSDVFGDIKFPAFNSNPTESPQKSTVGVMGGFLSKIEPSAEVNSKMQGDQHILQSSPQGQMGGEFPLILPQLASTDQQTLHFGSEPQGQSNPGNTTVVSSRLELNESAFEAASESLIGESDTMIIGVTKGAEEPKIDLGQILTPNPANPPVPVAPATPNNEDFNAFL